MDSNGYVIGLDGFGMHLHGFGMEVDGFSWFEWRWGGLGWS